MDHINRIGKTDAINRCFTAANAQGYAYFAVGGEGKCWGSNGTEYDKQGKAAYCPTNGKGAYGIINVYKIGNGTLIVGMFSTTILHRFSSLLTF